MEVIFVGVVDQHAHAVPRFQVLTAIDIDIPVDFGRVPMRAGDRAVSVEAIDHDLDSLPTRDESSAALIAC